MYRMNEQRAKSEERRGGEMFRFEELEIWKKSIKILDGLLSISDHLTENNLYRFAEQLRGAALSIVMFHS